MQDILFLALATGFFVIAFAAIFAFEKV